MSPNASCSADPASVSLPVAKDFIDVTKLRILRWREEPGLFRWIPNRIEKIPCKEKSEAGGSEAEKEGSQVPSDARKCLGQGVKAAPNTRKGRKVIGAQSSIRNAALLTCTDFSPPGLKTMNVCCVKLLRLW